MKAKISFLSILFISLTTLASSPVGDYNSREGRETPIEGGQWNPAWSKCFLGVFNGDYAKGAMANKVEIDTALQSIMAATANDKAFCGDKVNTPAGAKLFALTAAKALCVPEAIGCKPGAVNPAGATARAIGLFQIGVNDAKSYGCKLPNGSQVSHESQLKDGCINAACAAKIMITQANKSKNKGKVAAGNGKRKKEGFLAAFWQPVRGGKVTHKGTSYNDEPHRNKIAEVTKKFCDAAERGSQAAIQTGLVTEQEVAMALDGLVPRPLQNQPGIYTGTPTSA